MFSVECREASPVVSIGVGDGQERGPGLLNVSLGISETVLNITVNQPYRGESLHTRCLYLPRIHTNMLVLT